MSLKIRSDKIGFLKCHGRTNESLEHSVALGRLSLEPSSGAKAIISNTTLAPACSGPAPHTIPREVVYPYRTYLTL